MIGGEGVYPIDEAAARVAAARKGAGDAFYINARVDLYLRNPADKHDGVARRRRSIARRPIWRRARAASSCPGLRDAAAIGEIVKRTGALINIIPGPGAPTQPLADAGVARVSYGGGPWFAAMAWLEEQARGGDRLARLTQSRHPGREAGVAEAW